MSDERTGLVVERLRANLRASGIPFAESELDTLVERGLLRMATRFEAELRVRHQGRSEANGTLVRDGVSHRVRCTFD